MLSAKNVVLWGIAMHYLPTSSTLLILAAALLIFPLPDPDNDVKTDSELIEEIIARHDAAYDEIKSYHAKYTYATFYENPRSETFKGQTHTDPKCSVGEAEIIRQGNAFWFSRHTKSETDVLFNQDLVKAMVLNDGYSAQANIPMKANSTHIQVYWEDHGGFHTINQDRRLQVFSSFANPEPTNFGFSPFLNLQERYERKDEGAEWSVKKDDNGCYVLQHLIMRDGEVQSREKYWIDPDKDYLMVRSEVRGQNDVFYRGNECTLQKLGDGAWFPSKGLRLRDENGEGFKMMMTISEATVNETYPASQFVLEAMPIQMERVEIRRVLLNRKLVKYRYVNGQFVQVR